MFGERFEVDFSHVHRKEGRLYGPRLSYIVRHKSQLKGARQLAAIWHYGVGLSYLEDNGKRTKLWLCKLCHLSRKPNDAKVVNGTAHISEHMVRVHRIDPATGLLPETPFRATPSDPFEAARMVPGSGTVVSHSPWQEEALQSALIDWVIVKDVSFLVAVDATTRGLLTWNRSDLLPAIPASVSTIRSYILTTLEERRAEVSVMLQAGRGKISISVDVWTSPNHLSFLGVVAHFVGKSAFPLPIWLV